MADKNFVVKNGLTVGNLTIDAITGNVATPGSIVTSGVYTDEFFYANGSPFINAGYAGSQGPIGFTGSAGADGTIGVDGYTGSQGIQGNIGYTGSDGSVGYTGSAGDTGLQGNIGFTGSEGQQGIQGPIGYTGSAGTGEGGGGYTGSQGLPGTLASSQYLDAFTGNGVQTTFTLSVTPVDVNQTTVTIDGLTQLRSSYTLSNNSIIFSEAPASGDSIEVVSYLYGTTNFVTRTYTGDGNTTVYSVTTGVSANSVIVTDNGLVQRPITDYTVSGSSIIFAEAPADQTVVQIRELPAGAVGYTGSSGSNGYTGSSGLLTNWSSVTANYTAISGDRIIANTAGGSFNISLPTTPVLGDYVKITDGYNFSINSLTILRNSSTIENQSVDVNIDSAAVDVEFIYDGNTWQIVSTLGPRGYTGSAGTGYTGSAGTGSTVEILSPFLLMGG